jgi:hypothetical protein
MKRALTGALILLCAGFPVGAGAHHELPEEATGLLPDSALPNPGLASPLDQHSENMSLLANFDDGGTYRQGADEAFWGRTAVLSSYDNPGGFRILDIGRPTRPREIGQFICPGPQNDVSIWNDLVFVSVDSPRRSETCGEGGDTAGAVAGTAWEGIRVVDISDPANPQQIAAVDTDCGSHTHTLVPDQQNDRVLIYVESYPLNPQGVDCNPVTHGKISVVEVPLDDPASARVISTPSVRPAIGCHDVTVYLEIDLAAAACITESQIWDISDRANPRVISHIFNPAINIHHSTTFSWDGRTIAIGDELGGAAVSPGCPGADKHLPLGAIWFYDISDPEAPVVRGSFTIPQQQVDTILCTAHNFNTVPLRGERDVLVSGWYNGGTTVVDFTNPADPQQLGYYIARGPTQNRQQPVRSTSWSSYFYNGYIFANNFDEDVNSLSPVSRGLDVFRISDPAFRDATRVRYLNAQTMEHPPGG